MNRTIIVRRNYMHYIKKYARCVVCRKAACSPRAALGAATAGACLVPTCSSAHGKQQTAAACWQV